MKTLQALLTNALPVLLMIGLIPFIENDITLACVDIAIVLLSLSIRRGKGDLAIFLFGFVTLTLSETYFISTGVETFNRASLFGIMPLWLPILWGYAFIAIKRGLIILNLI